MLSGVKPDTLTQPDHPGAQNKNQDQYDKGQQKRFARDVLHDHMIKNAGQQPCGQQSTDR
jgi:hypothetical protein